MLPNYCALGVGELVYMLYGHWLANAYCLSVLMNFSIVLLLFVHIFIQIMFLMQFLQFLFFHLSC